MEAGHSWKAAADPSVASDVDAALRALLGSRALRLSERNRRFLAFVVDERLAGRAARIKAYTIGVDVFGRGPDFDPGTDPIVRIEATRIRSALSAYYEGEGANDRIRFVLRPGSYVPDFAFARQSAVAPAIHPTSDVARPAIVVIHRTDRRDRCAMAMGEIYIEAVVRAAAAHGFRIFITPPSERQAVAKAIRELLRCPDAVYALDVAVRRIAEGRRYSWFLSDLRSGEIKATNVIDRHSEDVPQAARIDELAVSVAKRVADVVASPDF